jgi:hypothetical protein
MQLAFSKLGPAVPLVIAPERKIKKRGAKLRALFFVINQNSASANSHSTMSEELFLAI